MVLPLLFLAGAFSNERFWGRQRYRLHRTYKTKTAADRAARRLRSDDFRVRVVRGEGEYAVYKR
jgi:hypothetical protein